MNANHRKIWRLLLIVLILIAIAGVIAAVMVPARRSKPAPVAETAAATDENGETLEAINGSESDPEVVKASKTIADKVAELCGNIHPKQLSNVYYALSQSALSVNVNGGFLAHGISSNEHMAVTFSLSRDDETGAVTIKYSEPKGFPVKFNWTTTIDVEGKSTTTPMRIDHGQYEAEAMKHVDEIARKAPGKDKA